jgi:septal ring factor EnvC (AmiA/AmiB activator)
VAHAQHKAEAAHQRVTEAIDRLVAERTPITFNAVAEAAGVTRAYLYAQPELRERIDTLRERQGQLRSPARRERGRTDKSKDVLLAAKDKRIRELEAEVERLKRELKAALGKLYEEL